MKEHKGEQLAILRHDAKATETDLIDLSAAWQAALDQLEGDPLFFPDLMEALRSANVQRWDGHYVAPAEHYPAT